MCKLKILAKLKNAVIASDRSAASVIARPRSGRSNLKTEIASSAFGLLAMTVLLLMTSGLAQANDVDVYNVSLQNYNGTASPKTVDIKFDLSQQNTFAAGLTDGNGASYYDRVWIFVKYFNKAWSANTAWKHATIVAGGSVGAFSGGTGFTTDGKGAFCRPGANQTLRWAIGTDEPATAGTETYKIKVFAIEMVYIPQGAFWVGSGGNESGTFTDGAWVTNGNIVTPFKITAQGAITIAGTAGNLWGTSSSGDNTIGSAGATNENFPTGYNGFFIMKYDISQGQYINFLHTLTYAQQATRTANAPNSAAGTGALVTATTNRNALKIKTSGVSGTTPAVYGCDLNGNGTYDEADDGEWVGCNYLSWSDLIAYADWAGLRPMTELEYEKACRGRKSATDTAAANCTANEYAWGDTTYDYFSDLSSGNDATHSYKTEAIGPTRPNANFNYSSATPDGPVRCGMFATSSSTRAQAGASYYGVMELSGNLWKSCVTVGNATGRAFTGLNGNGLLADNGNADVDYWPGTDAVGAGFRGSSWIYGISYARVSDRNSAAETSGTRNVRYGARLARTP